MYLSFRRPKGGRNKSNISRLKKTLIEKEIIEEEGETITLADPVFEIWFKKEYMQGEFLKVLIKYMTKL